MKAKIQTFLAVLISGTFMCESVQSQDQYRGLAAQRDPVLGSGSSSSSRRSSRNGGNSGSDDSGPSASERRRDAVNRRIDAANHQCELGSAAFSRGDYAAALRYFQNAVEKDPHDYKPFRIAVETARAAIDTQKGQGAQRMGDF